MRNELNAYDLGGFFVLSALVFFAATEVGYRFGRRRAHVLGIDTQVASASVSTIEAALLGLLALMLSFAFAMAMSRYDIRKEAVLEEVNDIRTAYMRSALLPQPFREESRRLLIAYIDSRIAASRAGARLSERRTAIGASHRLQQDLWTVAALAARANPDEVTTGYFAASVNEVIEDFSRRLMAITNHVPEIIFILLFAVAATALAVSGSSAGIRGVRLPTLRAILSVLVAAILTVIVDLDRPGKGLIKVSTSNIIELRSEIARFAP